MDGKRFNKALFAIISILLITGSFFAGRMSSELQTNPAPLNYANTMGSIDYGETTYVIGHKSPDTDSVVSAITYANLKKQLGINCEPAIAGKINNETKFVLDHFGITAPEILENAEDKNIILVDHSTYTQTIDGMKQANVVELIDHHGLGNVETPNPVYIKDMAVGATATIIYTSYIENGIKIDKATAGLLVSAILSDTKGLTSTTVTEIDRDACEYLAKIAEINNIDTYYQQMRRSAESYEGMTEKEIFYSDYKEYEMSGQKVGIAVIQAAEGQTENFCELMKIFMQEHHEKQNMDHLYAMISDEYNAQTILLYSGEGAESIMEKAFGKPTDGEFTLSVIASRKKDVVPPLERAYSEVETP